VGRLPHATAAYLLGALLLTSITGCAGIAAKEHNTLSKAPPSPRAGVFGRGDEVEVKFYSHPELDEVQVIRPDGSIALQLLGEFQAAGRTPDELRQEILDRSRGVLRYPEVTVLARQYAAQYVHVGGEVLVPQEVPIKGPLTVVEAIFQAGGMKSQSAKPSHVVVLRHIGDGRRLAYTVDVKRILEGKGDRPHYVQAQDIIFVPRTRIDRLNQWVRQHFDELLPGGLRYTVNRDDVTYGLDMGD
jgi:polysaccharide export outer membrane protein